MGIRSRMKGEPIPPPESAKDMLDQPTVQVAQRTEYRLEADLVADFVEHLSGRPQLFSAPALTYASEFYYGRGRADVIATTDDLQVIAFEAKLRDWRYALHQAYRNRCFASLSYVVLPLKSALRASRSSGEFARRRVGLCTVTGDSLQIVLAAPPADPLESWLARDALEYIRSQGVGRRSKRTRYSC